MHKPGAALCSRCPPRLFHIRSQALAPNQSLSFYQGMSNPYPFIHARYRPTMSPHAACGSLAVEKSMHSSRACFSSLQTQQGYRGLVKRSSTSPSHANAENGKWKGQIERHTLTFSALWPWGLRSAAALFGRMAPLMPEPVGRVCCDWVDMIAGRCSSDGCAALRA